MNGSPPHSARREKPSRAGEAHNGGIVLSIVIPLFEERDNLESLVTEIESVLPSIPGTSEVILVDDGSRDGSWAKIEELSASRPWLRAIRFLGNRGQTAAMAAGIAESRGDLIAFLDADLQNDPHDLRTLVAPILAGETDLACGWRADRKDGKFVRVFPSRVANFLIRHAFNIKLHDLGCSLKVIRREYLDDVFLFGEMHRFIPCYAQAQGARISEFVVNHRPRKAGKSKYGLERIFKVLLDILTVKMLNSYGSKPAYFFGKIAAVFFLFGTAAFGVVAYRTFVLDRPQSTPMVFMMLLFYFTSLLCLMSGLLAELIVRVLHVTGGSTPYRVVDRIGSDDRDRRD